MTNGTVTKEWAWTHHPAWYAEVTGRNPREDFEQARQRQAERERAIEAWEREQKHANDPHSDNRPDADMP